MVTEGRNASQVLADFRATLLEERHHEQIASIGEGLGFTDELDEISVTHAVASMYSDLVVASLAGVDRNDSDAWMGRLDSLVEVTATVGFLALKARDEA